ncbi:MAG: GAF domain-containing protein [Alphaproteobacteria bacterium]
MSVDLSACDREPIHTPGAIQPRGGLLAVGSDWMVRYVSETIGDYLPFDGDAAGLIGRSLLELLSEESVHTIRGRLQSLQRGARTERLFGIALLGDERRFDVALHRSGDLIVIELEPSAPDSRLDAGTTMNAMIARLNTVGAGAEFLNEAVRQVRAVTGFDRVMIYRFNPGGDGEVIAEAARSDLEPYLGLHYPASDIPKQARELYRKNLLRIISNVGAEPSPILSMPGSAPLDLSLSVLRAVSPVHIEYLRNMGVAASLSISILQGDELWGLIACHHMAPRHISFERRTTVELFVQMFALLMERQEREALAERERAARRIHDRLVGMMTGNGDHNTHLKQFLGDIRSTIDCDGAALAVDDELVMEGRAPDRQQLLALIARLNRQTDQELIVVKRLSSLHPPAEDYVDSAAGMLAIPVSRTPRDYLMLFRQEQVNTVTWAGRPDKAVVRSESGERLSPRASFAAWEDEVRGECIDWTEAERRIAEGYRSTILEVILRLTDAAEIERRRVHERQELLIAELNHRVRNILSLIRGLVKQSQGSVSSLRQYTLMLGGRIEALARAHDQITTDHWDAAPLRTMIEAEAKAFLTDKAEHVALDGPGVLLEPQAFSTLALVMHELMTNAAKYGALCDSSGRVQVTWDVDAEGDLRLRWVEQGGPPVQAPKRRGFGSTIIEHSVAFDLKGESRVDYALSGVRVELKVPAAHVRQIDEEMVRALKAKDAEETSSDGGVSGRVLLVEDTMIIALDAEDVLLTLGASSVDITSTIDEALRLIRSSPPDFALLDINLGDENSFPIALKLKALDIPFAFATGYGEQIEMPEELAGVPIIQKPYSSDIVQRQYRAALNGTSPP